MFKKVVSIVALIVAIFNLSHGDPVIFKSEVFYYEPLDVNYFDCYASNLDYGTLWVFETNSDLTTTSWAKFGQSYYIGFGPTYTIPYVSTDYDISWTPQVFMRMKQVGTNFDFYPGYDFSSMSLYDPEVGAAKVKTYPAQKPAQQASKPTIKLQIAVDVESLMPPSMTNRFSK